MLRRATPLLLCAAVAAPLAWSTPAWAPYHLAVIEQIFFGTAECPNAQYVLIRTIAAGQVIVSGQSLPTQNADGSAAGSFGTFQQNGSNGQSGVALLAATADAAALFGLTPDQVVDGTLVFPDGRVCFGNFGGEPVDCVAYGNYTGDNDHHGDPAVAPQLGMALVRQSETDDNATDFVLAPPAPENNAGERGIPGSCGGAGPTATPTETAAPTVPPGDICEGDCNDDGMVAVNELVLAVNIVLGNAQLEQCPAFPPGVIIPAINNLIRAVNNLLNGCPARPTATATATVPAGTPTATRTPGGPLGVRRFSLNPPTSLLIAVLAPGFTFPSSGFTGFLELTAGVPDPATGIAFVDVTDASEYLSINVPAGGLTLCLRVDRARLPVTQAGIVSCNGGVGLGLELSQDHNLGVVGTCNGGANAGLSCGGDGECPDGTCFTAAACTALGGSLEGPAAAHPGVCNSTFQGMALAGDSGPGAVLISPDPVNGITKGLPVAITMEAALPCGDEGVQGFSVDIALTTGRSLGRILDYNNDEGAELVDERLGENFSCSGWEEENGPGTFVFSAPQLDIMALGPQPTDLLTAFILDD